MRVLSHPYCFQTTLVKKAMPHVVHAMDKFKEAYPVVQAAAMCLTNLSTGDVSSEAEVSKLPCYPERTGAMHAPPLLLKTRVRSCEHRCGAAVCVIVSVNRTSTNERAVLSHGGGK